MRRAIRYCMVLTLVATASRAWPAWAADAEQYQRSYDLEATGKLAAALGALDSISKAGQQAYVFQLRRGWLLYLNGRYAEAVQAYERAVGRAPKSVEARLGLMLPQMALRRFKHAADMARTVLALDADNYLGRSRLAYCSYNLGRYPDAMKHYQRLVELYPADVEMRVGLGWAQLKLGKKSAAAANFSAVLAFAPNHVMARQGLELAR